MASKLFNVQVIRRFDFSADRVYDAFLDPEKAGKFMFASETGEMIKAEIEPIVGGSFVFIDRRPSGDAEHYGTYVELTRPKRLAFRFAVQKNAGESDLVTIDITPRGKGCEVNLTHEVKAEFAKFEDKIVDGWTSILGGLAETLMH